MFQTIYRLRLLVQENDQYFQIHLNALKEKEPTFNELIRKVERLTKKAHLNDYYLATIDNNLIFDDKSLQKTLKSLTSDQQQQHEIILCRKPTENLHTTPVIHLPTEKVPVIKPTVVRWTPAILPNDPISPNNIRRHSMMTQNDYTIEDRKDSGISLDEPHYRKKQRVMSADHQSRKLPDPSSSPLPSLRNHSITSLHPLEIRRPSTAPPPSSSISPPTSPFPRNIKHYIPPTLPTISSITSANHSPTLDSQLAPIHHTSKHNLYGQLPHNKRSRSVSSHIHSLFLCEHVTDHGKVCGQTFRRSYDLSRHQTIHLENRPFCYCDKCGRKFTRMDALRRHERVQGHSSKHRSMSLIPPQKSSV